MINSDVRDRKFCKELLTDLVNIKSVSGSEGEIIEYLYRFFLKLGFRVIKIPKKDRRTNLIVTLGSGDVKLCLNAHADTVPPVGNSRPKASIVNGKLYGLGASDDKGPLVAAVCAFKNLLRKERHIRGRVDLFISIGEEKGGEGTELAIKSGYTCQAAVTCESTGLSNIGRAQSGVYFMDVITRGQSGHGSKPWQGKNAIREMIALVREIEKAVRKGKSFYSIGPPSLNLGSICGGDVPNRIPDRCEAKLDIRLMPGEDIDLFKNRIKDIFKKKRWHRASYSFLQEKEPMVTHGNNLLVSAMSYAIHHVLRKRPKYLGIRGWTEAGNFARFLNLPAIIFGPGGMDVAHSPHEYIEMEDVYNGARIYEIFIKTYLNPTHY